MSNIAKKKLARRNRIRKSIRSKVLGTAERPRLSVYRSNKEIYAQVINDTNGTTIAAASSMSKELKGDNAAMSETAQKVGKLLAEKAMAAGISAVVFDRGGYLYHGRVKALADAAREAGLKF